MTKRYPSKRYPRKRRTKYLVAGIFLVFAALVVVSAYSDIPQLEPIRKQIMSLGVYGLSVGDTGEIDGLAMTLIEYDLVNGYVYKDEVLASVESWVEVYDIVDNPITPPKGAKFLFLHIRVENVGKVKNSFPCWLPFPNDPRRLFISCNDISLYYSDSLMDSHAIIYNEGYKMGFYSDECVTLLAKEHSYCPPYIWIDESVYPGRSKEGWIAFIVPEGIELEKTTLKIRGLVWKLG